MDGDGDITIPQGWVECSIGDITLPVAKVDAQKNGDKSIAYVDISSIDNTRNRIGDVKKHLLAEAPSRARQIIHSGDVLFSTVRPYLRNIAAVPEALDGQISSTGFSVLRPAPGVDPKFLFYKATSPAFVNALSGAQYGVSYPAVRDSQVREQTIRLPPIAEQRRIVAKLEALFSEIDKGVESLQTARAQLEVYRHALLKHAFEGHLTTDWRENIDGALENVAALLSRLSQLRESQQREDLVAWERFVEGWEQRGKRGPRPSRPQQFKSLEPLATDELDGLPTLPEEWRYVRLAEIAQIGTGMSVSSRRKVQDPMEVPYLRVANVQRGHLILDEIKTMTIERSHLPRLQLARWDVLFNEGGDRDKLGRGWIWNRQVEPCITQNHVFRASPLLSSELHSKWISYWGNSFGQRYFDSEGKQTTNLASINKTVLSLFPVPLAPIQEQEEIVQLLEAKTTVVDRLDDEIGSGLTRLDALRQAILKRAFAGRLVAQDPSDEPACVLLENIRAEREGHSKSMKKRKVGT